MTTRAERRAERARQRQADFDQFEQEVLALRSAQSDEPRRPVSRSWKFWIPTLALLTVAMGFVLGSLTGAWAL